MNRRAFAIAAALFSKALVAQETPTEFEAARPILAERAQLEVSLKISALIAKVSANNKAATRWSPAPGSSWTLSCSP